MWTLLEAGNSQRDNLQTTIQSGLWYDDNSSSYDGVKVRNPDGSTLSAGGGSTDLGTMEETLMFLGGLLTALVATAPLSKAFVL